MRNAGSRLMRYPESAIRNGLCHLWHRGVASFCRKSTKLLSLIVCPGKIALVIQSLAANQIGDQSPKPRNREVRFMKKKTPTPPTSQSASLAPGPETQVAMLQLLVNTVKDYAIIMLDTHGHILSWNPAAERLKGWKPDEIIGQHFSRFYSKEDIEKGKTEMELKVAEREGRFEDEGWRVRKDGSRFWANVIITALRDKNGTLLGFGKVTRDLTEKRQTEERLKKQTQEILEMATVPVVPVWEGILLVPLIGTLDSQRTQHLMERLLQRITETNSPVAVLDITGVPTVDTQTAQHIIETISSVRLLGAEVIMTGVRPTIAQTLVHLGIDLSNVITRSSLAAGLRMALSILELAVTPKAAATNPETQWKTTSRS
jgi:PAS domain S-box-containing protein